MSTTHPTATPTDTAVVLVEELEARGWTARTKRALGESHVLDGISLRSPLGSAPVKLLIITYPGDASQLVEFVCEPTRGTGKWSTGARFFWRMSAFDAPATSILAAARVAANDEHSPTFDSAVAGYEGWEVCATHSADGQLSSTAFVHPTGQVVATYHYSATPGECGGWLISAPDCHAEATAHTPGPVIRELAESLLTR